MENRVVTVLFSRQGAQDGIELSPEDEYLVRVDGGPPSVFRSPWGQEELETLVDDLRNVGEADPTIERANEIGRALGEQIFQIKDLQQHLSNGEPIIVCWQLDFPELARIPWELATTDQRPYHHLLLEDVSFVRRVPAFQEDIPAEWPTGRDTTLRLLFVWGERAQGEVPHEAHLESLQGICDDYGVDLTAQEIVDAQSLSDLCAESRFHFVHLLAHGAEAANGEWGLRLKNGNVKGEQVARALRAGGSTPALVTVAACDSANEKDSSFGSVAYQLHMYGVPLVIASQFRLRKTVSVVSAARVYASMLGGEDILSAIRANRKLLASEDNESWANEVIYSRYRQESLDELSILARQQAALRRARRIGKQKLEPGHEVQDAIHSMHSEVEKLTRLVDELKDSEPRKPAAEAETYGLLGSLHQRIAKLRSDPPDTEDLRAALSFYECGFRADANSHYCGINVVHLLLRVGDRDKAMALIPMVRFVAESEIDRGADYWAYAAAGDLEVYAERAADAAEHYRQFVSEVERVVKGSEQRVETFESSRRQLTEMLTIFDGDDQENLRAAATAALEVLDNAIRRNRL
jgi:hypothetical protein